MFRRWGAFVYRVRRPIAIVAIVVAAALSLFATQASSHLSSGGWIDPRAESSRVADQLAADFGTGRSSIIALFSSTTAQDATSPVYQAAIATALQRVAADGRVAGIAGFAQTGDRRFISTAGDRAYVVIELNATTEGSVALVDPIRAEIAPLAGYSFQLTGYGPVTKDSAVQSEKDLARAEVVSLPIVAIVLLIVFASLVAAATPLLVAGLAIPSALGVIYFVSQQIEMSIFVTSIATMLGLALSIDYSLFVVSRFREELARGRTVAQAVESAVATSGKAITFSGFAVMVGLSGLLVFRASALASIGIAGIIVVLCTLFFGLTFLPAALGMIGPRINSLSLQGAFARIGIRPLGRQEGGWWASVARQVMRRPFFILVPVLVVLFVLGSPFFHLEQGIPGASIYPAGLESRDAYVTIQNDFPHGETTPIVVLATVQGDPTSPANALALAQYAQSLAAVKGVDHVEGAYTIADPATGKPMSPEQVAAVYAMPAAQRPPQLSAGLAALQNAYVRGDLVMFHAISPLDAAKPAATGMTPWIRALPAGNGITTQVTGTAAGGWDFLGAQAEQVPYAALVTLAGSAIILFLLFGSLAIPIKAVVMTLLSISASFGALVWIFQDGHLSNVLNFTPLGYTLAGIPVIMFCVIFGLSMDYEVLLLSRIQEAWRRTGDNTASVAEGLARTAGVITGAALIMVSVFAAFALADTITIKSMGVGMAIAVAIDASIIRVLLVPATMRLLGRWNWWVPGPLQWVADRLGFDHTDDERPTAPTERGATR